jgi:PleD family two-component response regulator
MSVIVENECTVIIATEQSIYRNNLASSLRMQGHKVELATGGFHLLYLLENQDEGKIIVIIHEDMQDMSAYEIISLIRTTKTKQELPVLYVSRNKIKEDVVAILSVEANAYIVQTPVLNPILLAVKKYSGH